MASRDLMLQREGVREGLRVRRACVVCVCVYVCVCVCVCVFGGGVDACEDEREKRSAQYICAHYILLRIIWSHLQYVYLVFCMLYLVYSCSSRVVCLPCL